MSEKIFIKITVALLSAVALVAFAQNDNKSWGVLQLMETLAKIKAYDSDFIERKSFAFLTKELELKGTISYKAPDKLEKHTTIPFDERVLIVGDTITIEKPEDDQLQQQIQSVSLDAHPALRAVVDGVRSTLAGDLKSLEKLFHMKLSGNKSAWQLTLAPRNKKLSKHLTQIRIYGKQDRITRVDTEEGDGDLSILTMVRTNKK